LVLLLDVNVLVALFDPVHTHHEAAHEWFEPNRQSGWATCPLTENGFVRVISNPSYPGRRTTVQDALQRLTSFRDSGDHTFWTDSASLCDVLLIRPANLLGHRQLTDVYLLALAVTNGGRLATFDQRISLAAVNGAEPGHLAFLGEPRPEAKTQPRRRP
jgi:toxin-antitoxin system PIN domain toxin